MSAPVFVINDQAGVYAGLGRVQTMVERGLAAGPVVITLGREEKTREQEKRYHAMIGEIAEQVDFDGKKYSRRAWKTLLIDDYEHELNSMGETLTHPSRPLISLDGKRSVQERASSKDFRVSEASGFIEHLFKLGAEYCVCWHDPETIALMESIRNG